MEASALQRNAAAKPSTPKRPLRELLPHGRVGLAVGAACAALLALSFAKYGWSGRAAAGAILCPTLLLLAAIDYRHRLLPNAVVFPAVLLLLAAVAAFNPDGFLEHLWAGLALFGFLFVFALVFPAGLGMGDAKTGLLIGFALGWRTASAMTTAFAAVFVAALWILARHGLSARKQSLPFGPFLAFGAIVAFFFG